MQIKGFLNWAEWRIGGAWTAATKTLTIQFLIVGFTISFGSAATPVAK